jgi:hypothetical protein
VSLSPETAADTPESKVPLHVKVAGGALILVLVVSMAWMVTFLLQEHEKLGGIVRSYAAESRRGSAPRVLRPSADADVTTRLLSRSASMVVGNFNVHSKDGVSSACVWTTVHVHEKGGASVKVAFLLERQGGGSWGVASLSAARTCVCYEDELCRMP